MPMTYFEIILPDAPTYPAKEFNLYYSQDDDWVYHAMLTVEAVVEQFVASFTANIDTDKTNLMNKAHFHAMKWVRENLDLTVKQP